MRSGQKRYFSLHCTLLSIHVGQVPKQTPSSTLVWFKWTRKQTVFRGFKCWHTVSLRCSPKFISFLSVAGEKSSQRKVRWSRLSACHVAAAPITFRNHIHETFFFFFLATRSWAVQDVSKMSLARQKDVNWTCSVCKNRLCAVRSLVSDKVLAEGHWHKRIIDANVTERLFRVQFLCTR